METATIPHFTIHDRLRKARESAHLTQGELAHRTGISKGTVSHYEGGMTSAGRLKAVYLKEWALATGVDLDWLRFGDSGPDGGDTQVRRPTSRKVGEPVVGVVLPFDSVAAAA